MIDVSVIIVNYNAHYFIHQCITSVLASSNVRLEIIVVDNNSADDSIIKIKNDFPNVKIILNSENIGFSKANNQAVKIANGKYILILNPDTIIAENCLEKLIKLNLHKKNLGITGIKLINGSGNYAPESKRGIPTPKASFYKLFGISGKNTGKYYATHLSKNDSGVVDVLSGSFMFLKKSVYKEVNGFDEAFFMYGEDIDLSYRVQLKGYQNYYYSNCTAIHFKGESTAKNIQYLKYFNDAMEIFYHKHYRLNIVYDTVMKLGIKFWYFLKYYKFLTASKNKFKIVENINIKVEKEFFNYQNKRFYIVKKYPKSISFFDEFIDKNKIGGFVFDNNYLTFKEIINLFKAFENKGVLLKIRPQNTSYIIGSSSSKTPGTVYLLNN